ncbi:MAG: ABC transporter permease subunit [Caldilineaceae bacterium]
MIYLGGILGVNTWLAKGYFDSIRDLDEAAMMDGASHWQTFWRVLVPLLQPILVVIGLLIFIGTYSEYVLARVLLTTRDQYTLAVGLSLFIHDQYANRWGIFASEAHHRLHPAGGALPGLPAVSRRRIDQWVGEGLSKRLEIKRLGDCDTPRHIPQSLNLSLSQSLHLHPAIISTSGHNPCPNPQSTVMADFVFGGIEADEQRLLATERPLQRRAPLPPDRAAGPTAR